MEKNRDALCERRRFNPLSSRRRSFNSFRQNVRLLLRAEKRYYSRVAVIGQQELNYGLSAEFYVTLHHVLYRAPRVIHCTYVHT